MLEELAGTIPDPLRYRMLKQPSESPMVGGPTPSSELKTESVVRVLRRLLEADQIVAARRMLAALPDDIKATEDLRRLRRVLAPPVVRVVKERDSERKIEFDWLRRHASEYRGQWVALDANGLVATKGTLQELMEQLRDTPPQGQPLVQWIP